MSPAPRPAPKRCSPSAPALAPFSTRTGIPSRASSSSAGATPAQPGRMPSAWTVPVVGVDRRREPDAHADHARGVDAGLGEHVGGQPLRDVEARDRVLVDLAGLRAVGHDLAAEVADRGADVAVAEVEPDREGRVGRERDLQRRAADRPALVGGAVGLLLDHPGALELGEHRGDRRARKAERPAQLAAAARGVAQQRLEDAEAVGVAGAAAEDVAHRPSLPRHCGGFRGSTIGLARI